MKKIRNFLAAALTVVMILSMSVPAFAAEAMPDTTAQESLIPIEATATSSSDSGIMPLSTEWYVVGNNYTTVAYNPSGINSEVYIAIAQEGYNGWEYQMNIIMTDLSGDVVWRADNVTGVAADGHWWAGANVAKVQLQIAPRNWFVPERHFTVKVTY